jgi:hypothetical protein
MNTSDNQNLVFATINPKERSARFIIFPEGLLHFAAIGFAVAPYASPSLNAGTQHAHLSFSDAPGDTPF